VSTYLVEYVRQRTKRRLCRSCPNTVIGGLLLIAGVAGGGAALNVPCGDAWFFRAHVRGGAARLRAWPAAKSKPAD